MRRILTTLEGRRGASARCRHGGAFSAGRGAGATTVSADIGSAISAAAGVVGAARGGANGLRGAALERGEAGRREGSAAAMSVEALASRGRISPSQTAASLRGTRIPLGSLEPTPTTWADGFSFTLGTQGRGPAPSFGGIGLTEAGSGARALR